MNSFSYTVLAYALGGGLIWGYVVWLGWQTIRRNHRQLQRRTMP